MKTLISRITTAVGAVGLAAAATLAPVSQAHAVSGADVAAGIVLGGIAGVAIGAAHNQPRQVIVQQQPAVTYPVVSQPVFQQSVTTQPSQCYYPGPPAAYGPCPGGVAVPQQAAPQSYYAPVAPVNTVVYNQPAQVYYSPPAPIYYNPPIVYRSYYGPSFGYGYYGGHGRHGRF